jgi:glutathione S-transferase
MRLFQIPFSHNCIKARHVLDLKGLSYDTVDINPALRGEVKRFSGQALVPVLVDRGHVVSGSTEIALYLDERHPDPPLLPDDRQERAECLILSDWADAAFMALTRRLAYFQVLSAPGQLGQLFFPAAAPQVQRFAGAGAAQVLRRRFGISAERNRRDEDRARRVARIALDRLGGEEHLVGDRLTLADITFATMAAPLQYAGRELRDDDAVRALLEWGARTLGAAFSPLPAPEPEPSAT